MGSEMCIRDRNRTALAGVSSTSVDPRFLKLPARALDAGRAYFATARVVDRRTGRNNSLEVRLDVQSSPLVARLAGGSARVAGASAPLELDASGSYDPDSGSAGLDATGGALRFRWSCKAANASVCARVAAAASPAGAFNGTARARYASVVVAGDALAAGEAFVEHARERECDVRDRRD